MRKSAYESISEKDFQTFSLNDITLYLVPDPDVYNFTLHYDNNTTNSDPNAILDSIVKQYNSAWQKLSKL